MIRRFKNLIKKRLYGKLGVSFNPFGVPFTLGKHLEGKSNITMIDVGAYLGDFTKIVDCLCGLARGVLIEPQPVHAAMLAKKFSPPRFQVVEAVLCDKAGTIDMEVNVADASSSILKTRRHLEELSHVDVSSNAKIVCRAATLDEVYDEAKLEKVDLLKLDVQGAEHLVFRGGSKTLSQTDMVWTEGSFTPLYEGSSLHHELVDILAQSGFALYEIEPCFRGPRGELLCTDSLFLRK